MPERTVIQLACFARKYAGCAPDEIKYFALPMSTGVLMVSTVGPDARSPVWFQWCVVVQKSNQPGSTYFSSTVDFRLF